MRSDSIHNHGPAISLFSKAFDALTASGFKARPGCYELGGFQLESQGGTHRIQGPGLNVSYEDFGAGLSFLHGGADELTKAVGFLYSCRTENQALHLPDAMGMPASEKYFLR